jgi:hypothetical protein
MLLADALIARMVDGMFCGSGREKLVKRGSIGVLVRCEGGGGARGVDDQVCGGVALSWDRHTATTEMRMQGQECG